MTGPVNPRRSYNSPRRREQAAATRREILVAAERLFGRKGYAATTMAAIAAEAGVALKTVYVAFETKSGVLRALWNLRLRGDEELTPVAEQTWYREMLAEPDPERRLRRNARNSRAGKQRIGAVVEVIRAGAGDDPEIEALSNRVRTPTTTRTSAPSSRASTRNTSSLRASTSNAPRTSSGRSTTRPAGPLLVVERGWTPEQYEQWCADTACDQLLPPAGREPREDRDHPGARLPAAERPRLG